MLCKSVYDSKAEIPEFAQNEFVQRPDGKWYLKEDAIPGAAEHLNPGLAANRDRALTQKAAADARADEAEKKARDAETQLSAVRAPGSVVLGPEDAKLWQRLTQLGDVKTTEKIVKEEYPKLKKESVERSRETAYHEAVEDLKHFGVNLNFEALRDLMTHPQRGEGLNVERRLVEVTNGQGQKVKMNFPHIVKREPVAGRENEFTNTATPLLDFAQQNWPAWAVSALTAGGGQTGAAGGGEQAGGTGGAFGGVQGGVYDAGTGYGQQQGGNLLQLSTGAAGAGAPQAGPFGMQGGGNAQGGGVLPLTFNPAGGPPASGGPLKLPNMSGGGAQGGGNAPATLLDGAAQAAAFNKDRDTRPSPLPNAQNQKPATDGKQ